VYGLSAKTSTLPGTGSKASQDGRMVMAPLQGVLLKLTG